MECERCTIICIRESYPFAAAVLPTCRLVQESAASFFHSSSKSTSSIVSSKWMANFRWQFEKSILYIFREPSRGIAPLIFPTHTRNTCFYPIQLWGVGIFRAIWPFQATHSSPNLSCLRALHIVVYFNQVTLIPAARVYVILKTFIVEGLILQIDWCLGGSTDLL